MRERTARRLGVAAATGLASALLLSGCGGAGTPSDSPGPDAAAPAALASATSASLHLSDGWAIATAGSEEQMSGMSGMSGPTTAAYATVTTTGAADALVSASSPMARHVGLHTTTDAGGTSTMSAVRRLPVPAGGSLTLQPGGDHLMLTGLAQPLEPGDTVPLTLVFASGSRLRVALPVLAPEDRPQ